MAIHSEPFCWQVPCCWQVHATLLLLQDTAPGMRPSKAARYTGVKDALTLLEERLQQEPACDGILGEVAGRHLLACDCFRLHCLLSKKLFFMQASARAPQWLLCSLPMLRGKA